jgi:uncharacterized protein RhaS with RHS repeats
MKKNSMNERGLILLALLLSISSLSIFSQTYTVTYAYDAAGNRTSRTIGIEYKSAIMTPDSTEWAWDDIEGTLPEGERYESLDEDRKYILYPNPTKGRLVLQIMPYDETFANATLVLYDLGGKKVRVIEQVYEYNAIHMHTLSAGSYVLELKAGEITHRWKIVKE